MKYLFTLIAALCMFCTHAAEIDSTWNIVICNNPDASIKYIGGVMQQQLSKAFGKNINMLSEVQWDGKSPAVFLGWSEKDKNLQSTPGKKWDAEEWSIRQVTHRLIQIAGSDLRGVYNGALEFLERFANYRAYAVDMEYIDRKNTISLPENINLSGKPYFPFRNSSIGIYTFNPFWTHNRSFVYPQDKFGWYDFAGKPGGVHTFHYFSKNFKNDEYYALNANGVRLKAINSRGPGQICMSNPGARKEVLKTLLDYIRSDRENIAKTRPGTYAPCIYALSVNDNPVYCQCNGCKALYKKYKAISGAQLEFVNEIAAEVAKVYPDVYILTEAYMYLADAPKNIKARDNVIIRLTLLGNEFSKIGIRENMLPLTHPANKKAFAQIKAWQKVADKFAVWDYGRIYVEAVATPYTTIRAHAADLRYYADNGVIYAYLEGEIHESGRIAIQSFADLEHFAHMRLLIDPKQNVEALIKDFMVKYYGPAAEYMEKLLALLEKRLAENPQGISHFSFQRREYLDRALVLDADRLLTSAENAVKNHPEYLVRVRQERFPFDSLMLNKPSLKILKDQGGIFEREMVAKRWKEAADAIAIKYYQEQYYRPNLIRAAIRKSNETFYKSYINVIEVPDFLKNTPITADFTAGTFNTQGIKFQVIEDAEAAGGQTAFYFDSKFMQPFELGLYENQQRKVVARKVFHQPPQDEKYHWYKFSNIQLTANMRMWGHASWGLTPIFLQNVYDARNPEQRYDIYISFKLQGPVYVKGSTKNNGTFMDRIIVTPADKNITPNSPGAKAAAVPDFLQNIPIYEDFIWSKFEILSPRCKITEDAEAADGKTAAYIGDDHNKPFEIGIYDRAKKALVTRLTIRKPPQDEKYHWYKISDIKLTEKIRMWGHYSWGLTPVQLDKTYDAGNPDKPADIFVSCKLQGPAYVKGSTKANGCFIDRIIVSQANKNVVAK
ncbi:MAG: DUF4838 domain-containing protein [Lentisphaerae bacterium]|nr:DUF4838 domain-containing protein [Lentisphaerota bacterium]